MATGDETRAGPRPSLPPRQTQAPGPGNGIGPAGSGHGRDGFGLGDDPGETTRMIPGGARPPQSPGPTDGGFYQGSTPPEDQLNRFGGPGPDTDVPFREPRVGKAQILAPQANEWDARPQEVEVVKNGRFGLILLFLLALLAVAVIALGLAARSVFSGGDDLSADGSEETIEPGEDGLTTDPDSATDATETTVAAAPVPDPNQLLIDVTEDPFLCDGSARPFANLAGATGGEEVVFTSPQSSGILPGTANPDGTLTMRWQCDPEQVGTTWDITATGSTSGKTVTFSVTGVDSTGVVEPAPGPPPSDLTVSLVEDPFLCDGETRIFGGLSGAEPDEEVAFTSPQATGIRNGQADADGNLSIRWQCDPTQAGTQWDLTATGVTSGRSVSFSFTGS